MTIPIAHDYICPWCWAGLLQAKRLHEEFGVTFDWLSYELMPEELEWPKPKPPTPEVPNRPKTPSRLDFLLLADGITLPKAERPKRMRSHRAHLATLVAKEHGVADGFVEALYRAFWEDGLNINDTNVLVELGSGILPEGVDIRKAIEEERNASKIVHYDDNAYASGVYNVPTFFINGERYAEQPYVVLRDAVKSAVAESSR